MKIVLSIAIIVLLVGCTTQIQPEQTSHVSASPIVMGTNVQESTLSGECLTLAHDQTCETVCEEGFCERVCTSNS